MHSDYFWWTTYKHQNMKRVYCKNDGCRNWANLNNEGLCPKCVSSSSGDDKDPDVCNCNICKHEVKDEETQAIGCDLCRNWFHPKCVGNEDTLKLLDAVSNQSNFQGCLLWLCPDCSSSPRQIKVNNGICELSKPVENQDKNQNKKSIICKDYRLGACKEGNNCNYSHPAKCLNYCRFGRDGCSGGFQSCKLLHPVLCRESLNFKRCYDESCTLAHLKGTDRKGKSNYQNNRAYMDSYKSNYGTSNRKRSNYSAFDRNNLGFRGYQPLHQRNSAPYPYTSRNKVVNAPENHFNYNERDFPDTLTSQGNLQNENNLASQQSFLDLLESVRCIQEAQKSFQTELQSIKRYLPLQPVQGQYLQSAPPQQYLYQPQVNQEN